MRKRIRNNKVIDILWLNVMQKSKNCEKFNQPNILQNIVTSLLNSAREIDHFYHQSDENQPKHFQYEKPG